ncbi:hypothetical protein V490_07560 [Pseudogymnoascus sp. VKM F-3557]|nr:hypothetical protein V490_07560 [Pseudogymnoascus sp. VKM F-3557]
MGTGGEAEPELGLPPFANFYHSTILRVLHDEEKYLPSLWRTPRKTLNDEDRRKICQIHQDDPSATQAETAKHIGCEKSTISKVLRNKEKYIRHGDIRQENWALRTETQGLQLTGSAIEERARTFASVGNDKSFLQSSEAIATGSQNPLFAMPPTLEIHGRNPITFESAEKSEANIVHQLGFAPAAAELRQELWEKRREIETLAKHHLGLGSELSYTVLEQSTWIQGGFNICVPIVANLGMSSKKLIFRCPMPHKLAESIYPGTVDEKLSCELGAYMWIQDKCPDIRIPHLYGFGFSESRHFAQFTHAEHRPLHVRLSRLFWRSFYSLFRYPVLSQYTLHQKGGNFRTPYMLLEYIDSDTGQMLSNTWEAQREDPDCRKRLFQGISRIILSLARIPQPRIGSFQFHDDCTVTLTNRPLTCTIVALENEGTQRIAQKDDTYSSTESFVSDMMTFHDQRLLNKPNAVYADDDCRAQMTQRTLLRALSHQYINRARRNGPFMLQLTDVNPSNIFVDEHCNVTCLVDLEWICALPAEMLAVPYWLTGCHIDEIVEDQLVKFTEVRQEFMVILEKEEPECSAEHTISITEAMRDSWDSKGVWYWYCISSANAMLHLLVDHICPEFSVVLLSRFEEVLSKFWCKNAEEVVQQKVKDGTKYKKELRRRFGESADI